MDAIKSLDDVNRELHKLYSQERSPLLEDVKHVLESYDSNPQDWKAKYVDGKWSDISYTRHLVDEGNGRYNLMILLWNTSQGSPIHDHSHADCYVKILQGQLKETLFMYPSESDEGTDMVEKSSIVYEKNQVTHIHDNQGVVHRMENPSHTEGCVSLHLYTPPFNMCNKFDDRTSKRTEVKMSYHTKFGQPVESCEGKQSAGKSCCGEKQNTQNLCGPDDAQQPKNVCCGESQSAGQSCCGKK